MYFLDAKSLALELRHGTFSEYRAVKQAIAILIVSGGASSGILQAGYSEAPALGVGVLSLNVLAFIVSGLIAYFGMWLTYQVNRRGDGRDFFLRFAALSLPISVTLIIQYILLCVLLLLASTLLAMLSKSTFGFTVVYFPFAALLGFYLLTVMFYLRMRNYLALASGMADGDDV